MESLIINGKQYLNHKEDQLIAAGVPEAAVLENQWAGIREQRNRLLSASDWTQMADSPLSTDQKEDWLQYRQHLRDITENFDAPSDVVWPDKPA